MKTKLLFFNFAFILANLSCAINPERQKLIDAGSKQNAIAIYMTYNDNEKALVWLDKINQVTSLNCWNNHQLELLNILKGQINSKIFTPGESFNNFHGFMQTWKNQALQRFNMVQLRFIVTLVMDYNPNFVPENGGGNGQDCNCSLDSDWCGGFIVSSEECKKLKCDEKAGCGTLWNYKCTGLCQGVQPSSSNGVIYY